MPQSLTGLPQTADIKINGYVITIRDHKVKYWYGLYYQIMSIVEKSNTNRHTLTQFEKYGISFEAAIEYCVAELEHDTYAFSELILYIYLWKNEGLSKNITDYKHKCDVFSASMEGRKIVEQLVEGIRNCNDWGELYDQVNLSTKFHKDIKKRISMEIK